MCMYELEIYGYFSVPSIDEKKEMLKSTENKENQFYIGISSFIDTRTSETNKFMATLVNNK